jgi:hypothetical protein
MQTICWQCIARLTRSPSKKEAHLYLNEALARVATDKEKALLVAALKFIPLW